MARYIRWALIGLAAVLVVLLIFFIVQYQNLRQQEILTTRALHWSMVLEHHAPLAPSEAGIIRSWMTFDYINKLFALPTGYLQTQLQISDAHYPRLTISSYAKTENASTTAFLGEVENAVRNYVGSSTPSSTLISPTSSSI